MDVINELELYAVEHVVVDGYAKVICPFHQDTNPSGSISLEHGGFKCFSCNATDHLIGFLAATVKRQPALVRADLESRYGSSRDKVIDIGYVERLHKMFNENETYLREQLLKRKVPLSVIQDRRLGVENGRIIIPVYNSAGYVVNLRKYRPGGAQGKKVINHKGHGKPLRLYPDDQLKYDKIALCGGEVKALAALHVLNPHGIGAVTVTAGEGNWDAKLTPKIQDKTIYIAYDVDEAGQKGAEKVAAQVSRAAREVYIVKLPLDEDRFPTGDVNDFLAEGGDLVALLQAQDTPWVPVHKKYELNGDTTDVTLAAAVHADFTGRRVRTECVISAIGEQPYTVPRKVVVECPRDQEVCTICSVYLEPDGKEYEVPAESSGLLAMVDAPERIKANATKKALGIPELCKVSDCTTTQFYHIEDVRLSPKLEISSRDSQREMIPAYVLEKNLTLNENYRVCGRMHPHPSTQAATLLISDAEVSTDALSSYQLRDPNSLKVFQPDEWSVDAISERLNEIYADLEQNVTRVYHRRSMHLVTDIVYHSPLFFRMDGKRRKGWMEGIILGDSANGKSECLNGMMEHYRLGEKVDCKNATVAGLLGGLQQFSGKKWFAVWGMFPNMDRQFICLEELKGMHPDVFAKLTDMRSSGRAEIPKIEKRRAPARTRMLALSNPIGTRAVGSYGQGVLAFRDLIPNLEDLRRFDLGLVISNEEVSQDQIAEARSANLTVEHRYTSELCQQLILWAWTVHEDDIVFEAENLIHEHARKLCDRYQSEQIPLVDRGSTHLKLARISASLAARTFSHEDGKLVVRRCHVEYAVQFLHSIYDNDTMGYLEHSTYIQEQQSLRGPQDLKDLITKLPNPLVLAIRMAGTTPFDRQDLADFTGFDADTAQRMITMLVTSNAIDRLSKGYVARPAFIQLLRTMRQNHELEPPEYVKPEENEF